MLQDEFEIRVKEIEKYFLFLQNVEGDYRIITDFSKTNDYLIDDDLSKILKANGFLLLYNLIESTMFNSIVEIFNELKIQRVGYSSLSVELRKFWLKTKYKNQKGETHINNSQKFYFYIEEVINNLPIELIVERIDYGGSLDADKIRKLSIELGIDFCDSNYKEYPNGKVFKEIRDKRNALAHGKLSFSYIGKDLTFSGTTKTVNDDDKIIKLGLVHFKDFTVQHLRVFIESVEEYIRNEKYRIVV